MQLSEEEALISRKSGAVDCAARLLSQLQHSEANFGRLGFLALNASKAVPGECEKPSTSVATSIPALGALPSVGRVGSYFSVILRNSHAPSAPQPPSLQSEPSDSAS